MPPVDPKCKILTLRLSVTEYQALKALHHAHGARNVSEFARSAIQRVISGNPGDSVHAQLMDLYTRIALLESRVDVLTHGLQAPAECATPLL
ncbi:MAG: hypothetical protein IT168_12590 [Bryobacterales bacterium]|nr:hypothetical protein [Bryobacterales bacterium]